MKDIILLVCNFHHINTKFAGNYRKRAMKNISNERKQKIVAYWLLVGVFMIIVQIILGGITRLTDAGLSITEWDPIMGAIPPLNHADWMEAFNQYKQIGQYQIVNSNFTLSDFQFIFFWEWFHRLWARTLGVVFAIPFIFFIVKKYFSKKMITPLVILFCLGGLQGLIGWIMVKSGLNDSSVRVDHIKLAIHFISALVLLVYTFWFALKLLVPPNERSENKNARKWVGWILVLLIVQLTYGAFMAGLRAAAAAPTWPSINGKFAPNTLFNSSWIDVPLNVQFIHRGIAYILVILILWCFFKLSKFVKSDAMQGKKNLSKSLKWPLIFVFVQVSLGVIAVLTSPSILHGHFGVFESFAECHQVVAILLLLSLVYQFYLLPKKLIASN